MSFKINLCSYKSIENVEFCRITLNLQYGNISPGPLDFKIKNTSNSTQASKYLNAGVDSRIHELFDL